MGSFASNSCDHLQERLAFEVTYSDLISLRLQESITLYKLCRGFTATTCPTGPDQLELPPRETSLLDARTINVPGLHATETLANIGGAPFLDAD